MNEKLIEAPGLLRVKPEDLRNPKHNLFIGQHVDIESVTDDQIQILSSALNRSITKWLKSKMDRVPKRATEAEWIPVYEAVNNPKDGQQLARVAGSTIGVWLAKHRSCVGAVSLPAKMKLCRAVASILT